MNRIHRSTNRRTFLSFALGLITLLLCLIPSVAQAQTIYSTDFENFTATNWQGWSADNGVWQVGTPTAGPGAAHSPKQCAATGLAGNYPTFRDSRFVSPAMTLPSIGTGQAIVLNFWQWFQYGGGDYWGANPSYGDVEVSPWNGTTWDSWTRVSTQYFADSSGWMYAGTNFSAVDLSAYAGKKIRIGFHHNGLVNSGVGWLIDDVKVSQIATPSLSFNQAVTFESFTNTDWQGWAGDNGVWQAGKPTGGPLAAYDGTQCVGTLLAGAYPTWRASRLISQTLVLPSVVPGQSLVLGFWQWFQFGGGDYWGANPSFGDVEVSVWDGTAWGSWTQVSGSLLSNSNGWDYCAVDLSAYASKSIRIGFNHNGGVNSGAGWFVDDVLVSTQPDMAVNQTVTFENFTSLNWQGWSADNGVWQIGAPKAGPNTAYDGKQCAASGLSGNYPNWQVSRLISPAVKLPAVGSGSSLVLGFWQWFQFGGGDYWGANPSFGDVEVSVWDGTAWGSWAQVSRSMLSYSNGWDYCAVDLSAYATKRIRIGFNHNGLVNSGAGWFIDDVLLSTVPDMTVNQTVTFENFTNSNWQGWSSDNGVWQVGGPSAGPKSAFDGKQCAASGLTGNYPIWQESRLVSPAVTLPTVTGSQSIQLAFWQWFQFGGGDYWGNNPSYGDVEVSIWTGSAWGDWTKVSVNYLPDTGSAWKYVGTDFSPIDLSSYGGKRIRIGFHQNGLVNDGAGWFIDDVSINVTPNILSFTPTSGYAGTTIVTITGTSFTGATSVQFNGKAATLAKVSDTSITTTVPAGATTGPISVTGPGGTATSSANFTVIAGPALQSITLNPTTVVGSNSSVGTVTLTTAALSGGLVVNLASSDSHATVPASVTVPAGTITATFTVTTVAVYPSVQVTITGTQDVNKATATLTIKAPTFKTLTLSPTSVTGGTSSTATATLDYVAPTGGIVLTTKSDTTSAQVPSSVTIPAGSTSVTFTVTTTSVTAVTTANISATQDTNTPVTAQLAINPGGLSSVSTAPTTIVGGNTATGTITLNGPAPTGGTSVNLTSSSTTAVVPASVTVAAGATTATFSITTSGVDASTSVTITATNGGSTKTCTLTVIPAWVYTLTLSPTSVVGGSSTTVTGTVGLIGQAGPSGTVVSLTSSIPSAASVPATVTVPAGALKATFTVTTSTVTSTQSVTITGTALAHSVTATLTVNPSGLASITTSPTSLVGGNSPTGTITLNGPAPTGGAVVTLGSSATSVVVPASVTVSAGATTATFPMTTSGVDANTPVTLTATLGTTQKTCIITLLPAWIYTLTVSPTTVVGGSSTVVTGTVGLIGQAGPSGTVVTLSSSATSVATVPTTVTVPAYATKVTFPVTTLAVSSVQTVTLTGTAVSKSATATLTVNPSGIASVTTSPTTLVGGNSPTGTVTLNGPAPAGGALVTLTSSSTSAVVPASITVAAGATTGTFAITTSGVDANTAVTITATYGGTPKTCTLTLLQAWLLSFALAPTTVNAGVSSTGTVKLNGAAGPSGIVISLTSSDTTAATVPATVSIPSGATKVSFPITTLGVSAVTTVTITVTQGSHTLTAPLTINPSYQVTGIVPTPSSVTGGDTTNVTVSITSPAPAAGVTINLASTSSSVTVPATVTVPSGATSVSFTAGTVPVATVTSASIQAWYGTKPTTPPSSGITINPPVILAMVFSPHSVAAGSSTTLCVLLSGPAASGATLSVTSGSTRLTVGSTLTCVGGQNFQTFTLPTTAGPATTVSVTVTYNGTSDTDVLTITP